jgi:hypothetical protein
MIPVIVVAMMTGTGTVKEKDDTNVITKTKTMRRGRTKTLQWMMRKSQGKAPRVVVMIHQRQVRDRNEQTLPHDKMKEAARNVVQVMIERREMNPQDVIEAVALSEEANVVSEVLN